MDSTIESDSQGNHLITWQDLLDFLTIEASKDGSLNQICQLKQKSELEIASKCLSNEKLRHQLMKWMESCLDSEHLQKSATKSVNLRLMGNKEFKLRRDRASLSLYTKCISFAPHGSQELAIGFANRSAVLYHMQQFKECAQDAERALSMSYPDNLRLKILLRLAYCYLHLEEWDTCKNVLDLATSSLSNYSACIPGKSKSEIIKELEFLNEELRLKHNNGSISPPRRKSKIQLPTLLLGLNDQFPYASAALELRYSPSKGRYVVANQDIKQGDVLFIEKPYAFVVLPDQYTSHCHHCTQTMVAPVPCKMCTDVLFCSESCEEKSVASYHRWECGGVPLMSAIGVAHLGLRIVTVTGTPSEFLQKNLESSVIETFGNVKDPYLSVYSLLPHIVNMDVSDIFQYSATAMLLTLYLYHRTDYFPASVTQEKSSDDYDLLTRMCSVLLRHITQLVCNAHAITKLDSPSGEVGLKSCKNDVVLETQQRIATAIYPSASMMNHSCDPNIINSFCNEVLIVKASRNISRGGEVLNCYGPHHQRMGTAERQAALLAQYFFFCKCTACVAASGESFDPVQERLFALRCSSCEGPLFENAPGREPAGSKTGQQDTASSHLMVCDSCGVAQPISGLVQDVFKAHSLFRDGCEDMEAGHVQGALVKLELCRELQERSLFRSHKDLIATYDTLGKCYAMLGLYEKSLVCLKLMLPAVEEQYGNDSIEVAHELQKLSDVMMCYLLSLKETPSKGDLCDADAVIKRAVKILSIHYGEWNQGWQDLKKKADQLNVLCKLAGFGNDSSEIQSDLEKKLNLHS